MIRGDAKTIIEAIQKGFEDGQGKHRSLQIREVENSVKDFIAKQVVSKDLELERAFRIFFFRLFGGPK